jgi:Zn-dependent protease
MPKTIQIANPIKVDRLTRIMRIKGVDVYVHLTVFLIAAVMLANTFRRPVLTLVGMSAWLGLILIHECGHLIAAQWRHCEVWSVEVYPIHGFCHFETPWSRFDHCLIAWGGVVAQAVVAIPLVAYVLVFGYTRFQPLNAILAILGFYSLAVAAFNLLPAGRLDGVIAWGLIPELVRRMRRRPKKRPPSGWRSY